LFISAEREYHSGRAQNSLLPEHTEKITATFHGYQQVPGFSKVISREELRANADNLNIGRYVDTSPPPGPRDVPTYLVGGMPRAEIDATQDLLDACGVRVTDLFVERNPVDPGYLDFLPEYSRPDAAQLAELIRPREDELWSALRQWWTTEAMPRLVAAAATPVRPSAAPPPGERKAALMSVRNELITSFTDRLGQVRLLDRFALAGALVSWWHDAKYELLTLSQNGFPGVLDSWVGDVDTLLHPDEDPRTGQTRSRSGAERRQAYAHKAVNAIASSFLTELKQADARKAELDARWSELTTAPEERDEDLLPSDNSAAEAERSQVKRSRVHVAAVIRRLEREFPVELFTARAELGRRSGAERQVVLDVLRDDLAKKLDAHVARRRRELADTYRRWEDEYAVSLRDIRAERASSARNLEVFLGELGYR
jgi:type I restriction enzyme M protein